MKLFFATGLVLLLPALTIYAQECVLDVPRDAIIKYDASKHAAVPTIEKTKNKTVEKVRNKKGVELIISRSGCIRYVESYTFSKMKKIPNQIEKQAALAVKLLAEFGIETKEQRRLANEKKAFFKGNKFDCEYTSPCEIHREKKSLAIVFWFEM